MHISGTGSLWLDGEQIRQAVKYDVSVTQRGIMKQATGHMRIEPYEAGKLIGRLAPIAISSWS